VEVPGAEGADLPAKRARYRLTFKDDSVGPCAVPVAAHLAQPPNAAAAVAADGGASAEEPGGVVWGGLAQSDGLSQPSSSGSLSVSVPVFAPVSVILGVRGFLVVLVCTVHIELLLLYTRH
jgi:hypothetical protein